MKRRVSRIHGNCPVNLPHRLSGSTALQLNHAQQVNRVRVPGVFAQNLPVALLRLLQITCLM